VMLASFEQELEKIGANIALGNPAALAKPVPLVSSRGPSPTATSKATNYTTVHTDARPAAANVAAGTKATPPPAVRT
jgi:hypothetical protein